MDPLNEPTIREARPSDRAALEMLRLQLQSHTEASSPWIWHVTEEGREKLRREVDLMLSDGDGRVLVAERKGSIVGYAYGRVSHRAEYTPRVVGFINGIYVRDSHRRQRSGTRLVHELCKFFMARDVEEVNLRYILGNREAERFWSSLGLRPIIATANIRLRDLEGRIAKAARP